jgi:hypothetical protein
MEIMGNTSDEGRRMKNQAGNRKFQKSTQLAN